MFADIQKQCDKCGAGFWWTADEQQQLEQLGVSAVPSRCPDCRTTRKSKRRTRRSKKSTALVPTAPQQNIQLLSQALPDPTSFVQELRHWVNEAHTRYPLREPTLWERIKGSSTNWIEEEQRSAAAWDSVQGVISREKTMLDSLADMEVTRTAAETAIIHSRNEFLEAKLEQLRLMEQLRNMVLGQHELADPELEESDPLEEDPEEDLDAWYARESVRRKVRERAMADQAVISEFLRQVRRVFNHPTLERTERAVRIRTLMDSFSRGLEDLPAEIRKFLNRFESDGERE